MLKIDWSNEIPVADHCPSIGDAKEMYLRRLRVSRKSQGHRDEDLLAGIFEHLPGCVLRISTSFPRGIILYVPAKDCHEAPDILYMDTQDVPVYQHPDSQSAKMFFGDREGIYPEIRFQMLMTPILQEAAWGLHSTLSIDEVVPGTPPDWLVEEVTHEDVFQACRVNKHGEIWHERFHAQKRPCLMPVRIVPPHGILEYVQAAIFGNGIRATS